MTLQNIPQNIHGLLDEVKLVEQITLHPYAIFVFGAVVIWGSFSIARKFDGAFTAPVYVRLALMCLTVAHIWYGFDFLTGLNGGKNPFTVRDGPSIFPVLFIEFIVASGLLWATPIFLFFTKRQK